MPEIMLHTLEDTRALGLILGRLAQPGDVILLSGQLGVGKTTLTQFIAQGLAVPENYYVTSPSFALMHEYPGRIPMYHIDCYRLSGEDDVEDSGLMDYIVADGLSVVEWPDRLGGLVPAERLDICLRLSVNESRTVGLTACGKKWQERIGEVVTACQEKVREQ